MTDVYCQRCGPATMCVCAPPLTQPYTCWTTPPSLTESDVRRLIRDELAALVRAVAAGVEAWAISEAQYSGDVDAVRRVLRGARIAAGEYGAGWSVDDEGNRV